MPFLYRSTSSARKLVVSGCYFLLKNMVFRVSARNKPEYLLSGSAFFSFPVMCFIIIIFPDLI